MTIATSVSQRQYACHVVDVAIFDFLMINRSQETIFLLWCFCCPRPTRPTGMIVLPTVYMTHMYSFNHTLIGRRKSWRGAPGKSPLSQMDRRPSCPKPSGPPHLHEKKTLKNASRRSHLAALFTRLRPAHLGLPALSYLLGCDQNLRCR